MNNFSQKVHISVLASPASSEQTLCYFLPHVQVYSKGFSQIVTATATVQAVATSNGVSGAGAVTFLTNSWIAAGSSERVFFTAQPCLPRFTPPGLQKYRAEELDSLRVCAGLTRSQHPFSSS